MPESSPRVHRASFAGRSILISRPWMVKLSSFRGEEYLWRRNFTRKIEKYSSPEYIASYSIFSRMEISQMFSEITKVFVRGGKLCALLRARWRARNWLAVSQSRHVASTSSWTYVNPVYRCTRILGQGGREFLGSKVPSPSPSIVRAWWIDMTQ